MAEPEDVVADVVAEFEQKLLQVEDELVDLKDILTDLKMSLGIEEPDKAFKVEHGCSDDEEESECDSDSCHCGRVSESFKSPG